MPPDLQTSPDMSALESRFSKMVAVCRVMTLSVQEEKGGWSTPVYYLYSRGVFYFFSKPDSVHIQYGMKDALPVGASIFRDSDHYRDLQGAQMQGHIQRVTRLSDSMGAAVAFFKRHGIPLNNKNPFDRVSEQFGARFYTFSPDRIRYMDNRIRMGFKQELVPLTHLS